MPAEGIWKGVVPGPEKGRQSGALSASYELSGPPRISREDRSPRPGQGAVERRRARKGAKDVL